MSRIAPVLACVAFVLTGSGLLRAAEVKGIVLDPSGAPVSGAQVAAINQVGVIVQQITDDSGGYDFNVSPLFEGVQLRVTASGFQTVTVPEGASMIRLALEPQSDSIRVTGSAIDVPASQQGTSVSVITSKEIRERNEAQAVDLMRELPGMVFAQSGARGSVADLFVRGGDSKYNLVMLNGIPINSFYYGGLFDFSQIPSDFIEEIDVARGPQSAIYGSYANGSVVNFVTRSPENGPSLDVVAEGGTHDENRFSLSGSDLYKGWGVTGSFSSLLANGPVRNSDYRNDNGFLALEHRWYTQSVFAFGDFNSNDVGEPGPYGSNPAGLFPGLDLVSRSKNNTSTYGIHYQNDFSARARLDVTTGFSLNNNFYVSPYGDSFNKDIRAYGDGRGTFQVLSFWTLAGGFAFTREEMKNTYVATTNGYSFPLRRDNEGIYLDNQFAFGGKLFINAGVREEIYQTAFVPGDAFGFPARPDFPARTDSRLNPKISGAYMVLPAVRIHASFGTGIRPPGGADLAFTDNPALKPERTEGYDIGVQERFLAGKMSLDATWFRNRYRDLIVSLGGSLATLSAFQTDNIANALAKGAEFSAKYRPNTWFSATANYMWLETEVLSLNGGAGLVEKYFYLGQPLLRRPKQSGSAVATFHYGKVDANLIAYVRGHDLDVEPNYGASAGLYRDAGYVNAGINLNYRVRGNLTAYFNLRNALDRRYEEIYGFPAPLLNFVAGMKWSLARAR
ncbi:MAG TPA: TonB-dependent receptor [Bryobacteraceae bacterium]|nr:TonB-dependent receptor [Bryobacteraceae bacterium]